MHHCSCVEIFSVTAPLVLPILQTSFKMTRHVGGLVIRVQAAGSVSGVFSSCVSNIAASNHKQYTHCTTHSSPMVSRGCLPLAAASAAMRVACIAWDAFVA